MGTQQVVVADLHRRANLVWIRASLSPQNSGVRKTNKPFQLYSSFLKNIESGSTGHTKSNGDGYGLYKGTKQWQKFQTIDKYGKG